MRSFFKLFFLGCADYWKDIDIFKMVIYICKKIILKKLTNVKLKNNFTIQIKLK